jgi:hypothetical protein
MHWLPKPRRANGSPSCPSLHDARNFFTLTERHLSMNIAFLHTAAVHVETFNGLLDQLGYQGTRTHKVMPELLDQARQHGLDHVRARVEAVLAELATADAVMCTCSTLGPVADVVSQTYDHVFRIDRPVMEKASDFGPDIMVAICLESTQAATLDLLHACADREEKAVSPRVVLCAHAWPHFERGDFEGFADSIASTITTEVAASARPDCVLLAQASMRVAETRLADLGIPVFSSPRLAAERAIRIAASR